MHWLDLDDEDTALLVCTPQEVPPPTAWLQDDVDEEDEDDDTRSSGARVAYPLVQRYAANDVTYEPSRAEKRRAGRALGFPKRAAPGAGFGKNSYEDDAAAEVAAVATRRALTKAQRTPYEHLTETTDYAQLKRMLAHWGLTFPPGFDAAALAARFEVHPLGLALVHMKIPTHNADGDVCETASVDDIRRGRSIHLTAAERAASTLRPS